MLHFAQAQYLLLLAVIPLLFIAYGISRGVRKRRLRRLGDPLIISKLIVRSSRSRGWIKLILLSVAIFFFSIGLSRPQLGARIKEIEGKGAEIMIALDVSNSMLAEDYSPNRLERAKLAISRLTDRLKGDRVGLILFAGKAYVQLPITTDYVTAKMFLNSVNTNSVPVQGTSLAEAINLGIRSFTEQKESGKAIVIITDGEDHENDPAAAAAMANELGIKVFTIGVGSTEGKPIPMGNGELLRDKDGNIVVTKLDEETLIRVAEAGGGSYTRAGSRDFGLDGVVEQIKELERESYQSIIFEDFNEQYFYFFAIALLFFILEFLVTERRGRFFIR